MISRVFVRSVLVAIIAVMVYLLNLTWLQQFENIAQLIALTIIESGVLLSALSLLIESFISFGDITVNRKSLWFVLSGLAIVIADQNEEEGDVVYARNCELFWARSFILAVVFLMTAAFITLMYQMVVNLVLFLFNPYVPNILWGEVAIGVGIFVIGITVFGLLFMGGILLDKKLADVRVFIKYLALVLYGCIGVGTLIGSMMFLFDTQGLINKPSLYMSIMIGIGVMIALASFIGSVLAIGFGSHKLVGIASTRFPVLGDVWNTICPVQKVTVVR